jgi:alpha-beta hydrolase superfamily lysophospholipase
VLWHGFLATSYAWHKVAPQLAAAGLSVLVPDLLGFGDSAKPQERAFLEWFYDKATMTRSSGGCRRSLVGPKARSKEMSA